MTSGTQAPLAPPAAPTETTPALDPRRLRRFKLFEALDDEELEAWTPRFQSERRPRNEVLFREGEPSDRFYLVESGQVAASRLVNGTEQFLGAYVAGEFFGGSSILAATDRLETVDADTEVALLYTGKDDFLALCAEHPSVRARVEHAAELRRRRRAATFPGKRPEESLVVMTNRHVFWFLARAGIWSAFFVPVLVALIVIGGGALLVPAAIAALVYAAGIAWYYADWRNDWFIVSSRRVLHRENVILLFEKVEEAPLDKVQNVTSDVPNFLANLFDFGEVVIQTAAGGGRITFDFVPKSRIIREAIENEKSRLSEHVRQMEITRQRQSIRRELQAELGIEPPPAPSAPAPTVRVQERFGPLRILARVMPNIAPVYVKKGDQVIWRKHGLILLAEIAVPALLTTGSVLFTVLMLIANFTGGGAFLSLPVSLFIGVVLMSISLFWLWYVYRDWENDIYVLTPDRLIDSERKPLWLQERVRVASLAQVQNVTFKRETVLENVLDYGSVVIQTAGEDSGLTFDHIPNPRDAQAQISDALERFRDRERSRERMARRRELLDWFGEYYKLQPHRSSPPPASDPAP